MYKLNIIQANIQSIKKNREELIHILKENNYDIACLQETWLKNEKKMTIKGYNMIRTDRSDGYGGTCIILKKQINFKKLTLTDETEENIQTTAILLLSTNTILVSIYIAPQTPTITLKNTITKILHNTRNHKKIIIAGDFNSHHTFWGDSQSDRKGEIIIEQINGSNLIILKNNKYTCIPTDNNKRQTSIDLTIISKDIYTHTHKIIKDNHIGASNHKIIEITINNHNALPKDITIINKKKVNKLLKEIKQDEIKNIKQFTKRATKIINNSKHKIHFTLKSWWSKEIKEAYEKKNKARKIFSGTWGKCATLSISSYNSLKRVFQEPI